MLNEQINKDLELVKENGYLLKYVKNQTESIFLEAVKQNGYTLKDVNNQTYEICLAAVKQNKYAIKYVKNKNIKNKIKGKIKC